MSMKVEIKKNFGDFKLNIAFESQARRIGILGASGCGKSMTLKSIAGIVIPDEGYIEIDGRVIFDSKAVSRRDIESQDEGGKKTSGKVNLKPQQRKIGYLFQNYALFPTMTVEKNIEAGLKGSKEEKKKRVSEMITKFELQGLEKSYPKELSGGQQQRVALARIMAYEPDVILLDEPFSALDIHLKDRLQQEMKAFLADYQGIVILVSHSCEEIYQFCEELLIIDHGKSVVFGKTKDLFQEPKVRQAAILTGCKNVTRLERLDERHAYLPEWDVKIEAEKDIPENVKFFGYREQDFEPVWLGLENSILNDHEQKNHIKIRSGGMAELPFGRHYYIKPVNPESASDIIWYVQRDMTEIIAASGMPQYLELREDAMMFLQ